MDLTTILIWGFLLTQNQKANYQKPNFDLRKNFSIEQKINIPYSTKTMPFQKKLEDRLRKKEEINKLLSNKTESDLTIMLQKENYDKYLIENMKYLKDKGLERIFLPIDKSYQSIIEEYYDEIPTKQIVNLHCKLFMYGLNVKIIEEAKKQGIESVCYDAHPRFEKNQTWYGESRTIKQIKFLIENEKLLDKSIIITNTDETEIYNKSTNQIEPTLVKYLQDKGFIINELNLEPEIYAITEEKQEKKQ